METNNGNSSKSIVTYVLLGILAPGIHNIYIGRIIPSIFQLGIVALCVLDCVQPSHVNPGNDRLHAFLLAWIWAFIECMVRKTDRKGVELSGEMPGDRWGTIIVGTIVATTLIWPLVFQSVEFGIWAKVFSFIAYLIIGILAFWRTRKSHCAYRLFKDGADIILTSVLMLFAGVAFAASIVIVFDASLPSYVPHAVNAAFAYILWTLWRRSKKLNGECNVWEQVQAFCGRVFSLSLLAVAVTQAVGGVLLLVLGLFGFQKSSQDRHDAWLRRDWDAHAKAKKFQNSYTRWIVGGPAAALLGGRIADSVTETIDSQTEDDVPKWIMYVSAFIAALAVFSTPIITYGVGMKLKEKAQEIQQSHDKRVINDMSTNESVYQPSDKEYQEVAVRYVQWLFDHKSSDIQTIKGLFTVPCTMCNQYVKNDEELAIMLQACKSALMNTSPEITNLRIDRSPTIAGTKLVMAVTMRRIDDNGNNSKIDAAFTFLYKMAEGHLYIESWTVDVLNKVVEKQIYDDNTGANIEPAENDDAEKPHDAHASDSPADLESASNINEQQIQNELKEIAVSQMTSFYSCARDSADIQMNMFAPHVSFYNFKSISHDMIKTIFENRYKQLYSASVKINSCVIDKDEKDTPRATLDFVARELNRDGNWKEIKGRQTILFQRIGGAWKIHYLFRDIDSEEVIQTLTRDELRKYMDKTATPSTDNTSGNNDKKELEACIARIEKIQSNDSSIQLYKKRLLLLLPMIQRGASVNTTTVDTKGNTALHYACGIGDEVLVSWLIRNGANVNATTNKGKKPYDCVSGEAQARIRSLLKENGAK